MQVALGLSPGPPQPHVLCGRPGLSSVIGSLCPSGLPQPHPTPGDPAMGRALALGRLGTGQPGPRLGLRADPRVVSLPAASSAT